MQLEASTLLTKESSEEELEDSILAERLEEHRQCRVLVVDDDDLVRAKFSSLLKSAHYDVELASTGEEALRILANIDCHLVLTDWQMPDMDGLALCREVRLAHQDRYIYVLMLTVRSTRQDVLLGLASGADDYIVKGAPISEILARLEVGRRITHVDDSVRAANQENKRLSLIDQLTEAYNLRYLMKYLPRELSRAQRYSRPLAVLNCDIDDFKQFNDCHGHAVGDEILRGFVKHCDACIRQGCDWLARVGGDEFIIVLPETSFHGAAHVEKKLRRHFATQPILTRAGPIQVRVSIGVTAVDAKQHLHSAAGIEDLIRTADRRMYADKQRNGEVCKNEIH
jgi:diguanylate cyclase (GGDEF)-like protein